MKVAIIYNKDLTGVINTFGMQNKEMYSEKTVRQVASALENAGHNVAVLDGNMYVIERLQNFMPRVIEGEQMGMVFNMAYGIQGESRYTHIPSMLEMLGIPYVGSSPSGHALALDKVITKILWQNHGLPTPGYWVFNSAADDMDGVKYPVIVKPKMESVSFGLRVVYNEEDLREAVNFIVAEFQQQALVEQFVRGREFCIGLIGNDPIETFPILEIDLEGDPDAIQTMGDKKDTPKGKICPANLPDDIAEKMRRFSIEAFKALSLRDFARVDFRVDQDGEIYLLEINSMASMGPTGSYPAAALVAGYDYPKLVNKMLDVAAIRYFSNTLMSRFPQEKEKKLPLHNRLRTFLRGRQQNTEKLLKSLVNNNTHVRNVEGVNQCAAHLKTELAQLGFTGEVHPQYEVGNLHYFCNSMDDNIDILILLSLDNQITIPNHKNYHETEHRIYGSAIWENKGGIVCCLSALQALRFSKLLRKSRIGILLGTDSCLNGKCSKDLLNLKASKAKHVLSLHGGNTEGSVVLSRSGSGSYNLAVKLTDSSDAGNVVEVSRYFTRTIASILDTSKKDPEDVIAPYDMNFESNIFKVSAHGTAKISVRFNTPEKAREIDTRIKKIASISKKQKEMFQVHFEGGVKRPPMIENQETENLFNTYKSIADSVDVRISREHRWSSSDICNLEKKISRLDGLGPTGGYRESGREYILRHSLVDRSLILALLIKELSA